MALLPSGLATSEQLSTGCWQSDVPCQCQELSVTPREHHSDNILYLHWCPFERKSGHSPATPASLTKCSLQQAGFPEYWIPSHQSSPQADTQAHRKLHGWGTHVPRNRMTTKTSAQLWCVSPTYLNYFSAHPAAWLSLEPLTTAVTSKFILQYVTSLDRRLFGTLHSITYTLGHPSNPVLLSGALHLWFSFYILGSNFSRECNKTHGPLPLKPHKTN